MIDLHAHTTASDGSLTPTELVRWPKKPASPPSASPTTIPSPASRGDRPRAPPASPVPGVELSVDYPHGQFHLLGYFVDFTSQPLLERLQYLQDNRSNRNEKIIELMQQAGLPITMADLEREAGGDVIGRPHMALAMIRKGIVASTQEAFDRYLADGKPLPPPQSQA